jgi:hypothetical protein
MKLALTKISDLSVVNVFDSNIGRLEVPGLGQVSPPMAGWEQGDWRIVSVIELQVPNGKRVVGPITTTWIDGVLHETATFEDISVTADDVDAERDRRVSVGFTFNEKLFQSRIEDQKRINGASTLALIAVVSGAQPGNLRWHGGTQDFVWIADDNTLIPMDAQTVLAFGQAAAAWESDHVFAARSVKDTTPVPADYTDNKYWPS